MFLSSFQNRFSKNSPKAVQMNAKFLQTINIWLQTSSNSSQAYIFYCANHNSSILKGIRLWLYNHLCKAGKNEFLMFSKAFHSSSSHDSKTMEKRTSKLISVHEYSEQLTPEIIHCSPIHLEKRVELIEHSTIP